MGGFAPSRGGRSQALLKQSSGALLKQSSVRSSRPSRAGRPAIECRAKKVNWKLAPEAAAQPLPKIDYAAELTGWRDAGTCPPLLLAPMESLGDRSFRRALAFSVGGMTEACTEFIRCPPDDGFAENMAAGIAARYDARELVDVTGSLPAVPLGAQVMGADMATLAATARRLAEAGAPRVDLNCGCPANGVVGKGAGSSMLRSPEAVLETISGIREAVGPDTPVTVKMRSGFADTSLFEENLLAAQEAGVTFVTIHPRTRTQGYKGAADWDLIAAAKQLLSIPVIGNGDVTSAPRALRLLEHTGCDGVMIGRGAVQDPLIFHRIRAAHGEAPAAHVADLLSESGGADGRREADLIAGLVWQFHEELIAISMDADSPKRRRGRLSKVKQIMNYLFASGDGLQGALPGLLTLQHTSISNEAFAERVCAALKEHWPQGGPGDVLVNHRNWGLDEKRHQVILPELPLKRRAEPEQGNVAELVDASAS